jgi:hypothetical protein
MKTSVAATMGLAALLASFAGAARAWEEPDAVFAKYHRAIMAGNAEEMIRLTPAARRAELAARKESELRRLTAALPAAYALEQKVVSRDGQSARLIYSAPGEAFEVPRAGAQFGIVRMALEGGEWRLVDQSWAREKPAELAPARSQASEGGRVRDMTRANHRPVPPPVLRVARPGCTYKGVMSDEEIARCR